MKLYLISQSVNTGYDTYDSAVVAAQDAEAARRTYPDSFYKWSEEKNAFVWPTDASETAGGDWAAHISQVEVRYLGEADAAVEAGVICASFNAG